MTTDTREDAEVKRSGFLTLWCWGRWHTVVIAAVWTLFALRTVGAQSPSAVLPTLTTALAAHQLTAQEAQRHYPVRLRAVVTYYDPFLDQRQTAMFVQDSSRGIFVALMHISAQTVAAGDLVEVTGLSSPGDYSSMVDHAHVRVIGKAHLPFIAPRLNMNAIMDSQADAEWAEIEGVVHEVHTSGKNVYINLALKDGDITAISVKEDGVDYNGLVDSRILLRGVAAPMFNHKRQMTGARIFFPSVNNLKVVESAPARPFGIRTQRVADLLLSTLKSGMHHRDHIRGMVTLFWPGRMLCVQDGSGSLCAQIDRETVPNPQDRSQGNVQLGAIVDVIGFSEVGEFTPTLIHSAYQLASPRVTDNRHLPVVISASQAMHGDHDAGLITIEGKLIGYDRAADDPTLMLSSGNFVFPVVLPKQSLSGRLSRIEEGSLLRVTGICSVLADTTVSEGDGFPVGKSFRILLQSAEGITVARRPSWWNAAHALSLFAVALLAALAAILGVVVLRHRVQAQTRTIRESEARFRHLATHDSLTKLPNRASILSSLEGSINEGHKHGTPVCVALIDLDHFKYINDTLGHLAGDEVLRESARRLASAIRSDDVVGRYGGEEFLVVFNNMELETGAARCELVRQVLCAQPICWEEQLLTITCSIGVVSSHNTGSIVPTLIARADEAMYTAKTLGRNRVETVEQLSPRVTERLTDRRSRSLTSKL